MDSQSKAVVLPSESLREGGEWERECLAEFIVVSLEGERKPSSNPIYRWRSIDEYISSNEMVINIEYLRNRELCSCYPC